MFFANPRETNIQLFRALTPLAVMQSTDKGQLDAKGSAIRNGRWSGVTRKQRCASSRYLCRRQSIYSARRQPRPVEPTIASSLARLCAAQARRDMDPQLLCPHSEMSREKPLKRLICPCWLLRRNVGQWHQTDQLGRSDDVRS